MMMNLILSAIMYTRSRKNLLSKKYLIFLPINYWNKYKFLLAKEQPLICFKDENKRVGNFFYAYPDVNLNMTFFASQGCLGYEVKEVSKFKWIIMFLRKVR